MYDVPCYKEHDFKVVKKFMEDHPFAVLCGCDAANTPVATQIPLFIEEEGNSQVLKGHIMKHTDHYQAFVHNPQVLAVFTGPHSYVSATCYTHPCTASTWNYMSVHAKGAIRFLDEKALEEILRKTTLHFEDCNHHSPTAFDNLPKEYNHRLMKEIAAFEIEIKKLDAVFKLSQDKDEESYKRIVQHLSAKDDAGRQLSQEMEKRMKDVY